MENATSEAQYFSREHLLNLLNESKEETGTPYEHDGSYEIVQRAATLYKMKTPKNAGRADLDLFYYLPLLRGKEAKQRRIDCCNLDNDQKADLTALLEEVQSRQKNGYYRNQEVGQEIFGMFTSAMGTYNRENSVPIRDAQKLIKLFADLSESLSEEEKIELVEQAFTGPIKWFKNGTASQILHCIDPFTFPIINGHQGRDSLYTLLGIDIPFNKDKRNDLTRYAEYCREIKRFRDENCDFKFYRVFDWVEASLPQVRGNKTRVKPSDLANDEQRAVAVLGLRDNVSMIQRVHEEASLPNLFDILKITKAEIRHSNVLAWLFDPAQNHGMDDEALRGFLNLVAEISDEKNRRAIIEILHKETLPDFVVYREKGHIDLLLVSEDGGCVVAIENKTYSSEGKTQLSDYHDYVEREYRNMGVRLYIYLTREGELSSNPSIWRSIGYRQLIDMIDDAYSKRVDNMSSDSAMIVEHYSRTVRAELLDESQLKWMCRDLYKEHRLAFDTVFKLVKGYSETEVVSDLISDWLQENSEDYGITWCEPNDSSVFFSTGSLDDYLCANGIDIDSGGNAYAGYSYVIEIDGDKTHLAIPALLARHAVSSGKDWKTSEWYNADKIDFESLIGQLFENVYEFEEQIL